jgi:hypothetical protein
MQGDVDRPTYIARSAKLLGVSLTHSPATVAARPVEWRAGDLRRSADTYTWPGSWRYHDPLLARAVDQVGDGFASRDRAATRIVDRRDDGYGYGPPPIRSWDRMQTRDWRTLPGGLMKSAHRGRVMRVY